MNKRNRKTESKLTSKKCRTKNRRQTRRRKVYGGKPEAPVKMDLVNGILFQVKMAIAEKMTNLMNAQVTARIQNELLKGLPPIVQSKLTEKLDYIAYKMVKDMSTKALGVAENMLKSSPGAGNIYSALAAVDKAFAAFKNLRISINKIAQQVKQAKAEVRAMGLDPDALGIPDFEPPSFLKTADSEAIEMPSLPSMPSMPSIPQSSEDLASMTGMPSMPSVPSVPQSPQDLASMTGMPSMPSVPSIPQSPQDMASMTGMPSMPKGPTLPAKKGGGKKYKNILSRTKRSIARFHNSTVKNAK